MYVAGLFVRCGLVVTSIACHPFGPNFNYGDLETFDRTYIRFRFPDLGKESPNFPPGLFVTEKDKKTYYLTLFFEEQTWLPNRSLQPEEWFWKKFYEKFSDQPPIIRFEPRFNILPNCEYFVPAPAGIHRFVVFTYNRNHAPIGGGRISKTIHLLPEHSLRIHLRNPKDLSESQIDPSKYVAYSAGDQILFSLEPTPARMEPQICEPELHSKN
ncbi:hypothetical protein CH371_12750 [Leptospira wolffii]|uniref:Uncharacterized protein n=1 Tax=Leptospira wolffii TaxID=409998 RepID=A0A2M9ZA96_9LEPT|nr:hypothetical protein CH371_12750 [Leptospira wolffii]